MKSLNEWLDAISRAIPEARASGHLPRFINDVSTALLAADPCMLRDKGMDGPRRINFYRNKVLALVRPLQAHIAA